MTSAMIELDEDTRQLVERLAFSRRCSAGAVLRTAIEEYVAREERRAEFYAAGQFRWREYQETGRHVREAEADAWLVSLESGEDTPMPECHA